MVRSLTTAFLAVGVLLLAGYEIVHTGAVDTSVGAFVGLVLGFYFGAHIAQNGGSSRARRDAVIVAEATGQPIPPDDYDRVKK